jgi:hypothetical protein
MLLGLFILINIANMLFLMSILIILIYNELLVYFQVYLIVFYQFIKYKNN